MNLNRSEIWPLLINERTSEHQRLFPTTQYSPREKQINWAKKKEKKRKILQRTFFNREQKRKKKTIRGFDSRTAIYQVIISYYNNNRNHFLIIFLLQNDSMKHDMTHAWHNLRLPPRNNNNPPVVATTPTIATTTMLAKNAEQFHEFYTLGPLLPDSSYEAKVSAKNIFGWSESSNIFQFYTQGKGNYYSLQISRSN